jgi:hypothetical protein
MPIIQDKELGKEKRIDKISQDRQDITDLED